MSIRPSILAATGATLAVVAFDQITKAVVAAELGPQEEVRLWFGVRLVRVANRGMAFSVGNGGGAWRVAVIAVVLLALLAWVGRRELARPADDSRAPSVGQAITFGVLFGGAMGNVIDRLIRAPGWGRGAVVDFVDVGFWPVFNVADAALTCGCVAFAVLSWRRARQPPGDRTITA